jgi:hypothetical protein
MALQTPTLPSGNLFAVAAQYLGDPTQWYLIAQINGMIDPFFTGPLQLTIPNADPSGGNGGILGQ